MTITTSRTPKAASASAVGQLAETTVGAAQLQVVLDWLESVDAT